MNTKLYYRDNWGRFIGRKALKKEMLESFFILGHVAKQEMILSFVWRITRDSRLPQDIRECRSLARRIALGIRECRIKYRIYETF